ncbi:hypothetical protein, partial [Streptomyces albidoflavus]|uniref:hypothetical protein n=1 Tax=Streptomyces albidoflavus TaxID=1886 RepID=UPI001C540008
VAETVAGRVGEERRVAERTDENAMMRARVVDVVDDVVGVVVIDGRATTEIDTRLFVGSVRDV